MSFAVRNALNTLVITIADCNFCRNSEFAEVMNTKKELLTTIRTQQQQYDRISNLHKHLIAKLEAYMFVVSLYIMLFVIFMF